MKVLLLTNRIPFPPTDGGAISTYELAANFKACGHEVTMLAINTPKHFQPDTVMADVVRLIAVYVDTDIKPHKAFLNLFSPVPYIAERFISKAYEEALTGLLKSEKFDVIQMESVYMAYYIDTIRAVTNIPVTLRAQNIEYVIWERLASNEKNLFKKWYYGYTARGLQKFEQYYLTKVDAIAAITTIDKQRIHEMGIPTPVYAIPASVSLSKYKLAETEPLPYTFYSLSSMNWIPNVEALDWFIEKVWSKVTDKKLELHIAGVDMPARYAEMKEKNIFGHGFVNSATEYINKYAVQIVPLLSGGGMRIKIIEAMAMGKCIISTSVGAEGIEYENRKNILIADTPQQWLEAIQMLTDTPAMVKEIGKNARITAETVYESTRIMQLYEKMYQGIKK